MPIIGTSTYSWLDRSGFQNGPKEYIGHILTSNINQKNHWWGHKSNAWEDYRTARNIKSSNILSYFHGTTLIRNKDYSIPCHKPYSINQGVNMGEWPSVNHKHIYIYMHLSRNELHKKSL